MEQIITYINIFLWWYGVTFALVALFGFSIQRNKERGYKTGTKITPEEITVLIPFRNEVDRLPALLKSIKELKQLPHQFVFIDDHSEDASSVIISEVLNDMPITLIQQEKGALGKKRAIRAGAKLVETEYTLTWDADIVVSRDYFAGIGNLTEADMYVLPAIFISQSFWQHLFTFDVVVANAVNTGLAGWRRPIFASGANLLYRTKAFEEFDSLAQHRHISSGDDTFLLRDFVRNRADVRLCTDPNVAIKTPAPKSFRDYIAQRLRWVSKTGAVGDFLNTIIALKQLIFTLAFGVLIGWTVYEQFWFGLIYLLICKCLTDFLVFGAYFKQIRQSGLLLLLPIAQVWFPIYSILLAVLVPFYQPKWKGRKIVSK